MPTEAEIPGWLAALVALPGGGALGWMLKLYGTQREHVSKIGALEARVKVEESKSDQTIADVASIQAHVETLTTTTERLTHSHDTLSHDIQDLLGEFRARGAEK